MTKLNIPAIEAAKVLLGWEITRIIEGKILSGIIVETEAYDQTDAASHSFSGKTPRTDVMFGPSGHAYVYFTYGMHFCMNIVTGAEGEGSAVLIRAIQPVKGIDVMKKHRNKDDTLSLTNGPAKLCQALHIDKKLNGHDLSKPPLFLSPRKQLDDKDIVQAKRVGISREKEKMWRFYIKDNPFVSVKI